MQDSEASIELAPSFPKMEYEMSNERFWEHNKTKG